MNINADNPSLQNIITRTLIGQNEKRPSFEEVFDKLNKNSVMMKTRMPVNSVLTNEQMCRCYVLHTIPKLKKSNDTFGKSELNTVLMKLLGNDPSGNALTAPLAPVPLAPVPLAPALAVPPLAPTAISAPTLTTAPSTPTGTPLLTGTPTPMPALTIPPTGSLQSAAPSPVLQLFTGFGADLGAASAGIQNIAQNLFPTNPSVAGLPAVSPRPQPQYYHQQI